MKKILIFGMTSGYGGIESFIMNVFRNLDASKYEFRFVKNEERIAYEDELLSKGVTIYKITSRNSNIKKHYRDIEDIFKQQKFDIVWTNRCMLNSVVELKYAKKYNCPVRIMHAHSSKNTGSRLTQLMHEVNKSRLDSYSTLKFSCSKEATAYFYKQQDDVIAIKNGLDVRNYLYDKAIDKAMRRKLDLQDAFLMGHVGRFTFEKNQKFAIDVFHLVKKQIPNAKLILCGKGPLFEECQAYVESLHLKEDVLFMGEVKNIPEILQCLNTFVFPSLFEGLPYAALEAQLTGMNCYISKHVSPEVVLSDRCHLLEIQDPQLWAEQIIASQNDKKIRNEKLLESPFSILKTCKQIDDILQA